MLYDTNEEIRIQRDYTPHRAQTRVIFAVTRLPRVSIITVAGAGQKKATSISYRVNRGFGLNFPLNKLFSTSRFFEAFNQIALTRFRPQIFN